MLVRSKIYHARNPYPGEAYERNPVGLTVHFGEHQEREYKFTKDGVGDYVCDIDHEADLSRLLSIAEGYELHPAVIRAASKPKQPEVVVAKKP
jgi:hypothetical protein